MIEKIKQKLKESNIDNIDKIIEIISDYLPQEHKKNVNDLLRYVERKYQKKYGDDEIFVSFPIPAKMRINIANFKKQNAISYQQYCKFSEWLLECQDKKISVYDLIEQRLYDKFLDDYEDDKELIQEKKELNKSKILRFRLT